MSPRAKDMIYVIAVGTLALFVGSVVFVMLFGLFDQRVDNNKIFEILSPNFSMVVGAMIGLIGGKAIEKAEKKDAA